MPLQSAHQEETTLLVCDEKSCSGKYSFLVYQITANPQMERGDRINIFPEKPKVMKRFSQRRPRSAFMVPFVPEA